MMVAAKTILLCTIGSAGDVNPFIAIGESLRNWGFRVVLVTSQYFEAQVRSAGLEFVGLGIVEDYQAIIQNPDLWDPNKGFRVFAESVVFPIMEPAYRIISGFDPHETVLVAQGQFFAAHIAHEKLGFPFITVHLQPAAFRSVYDFPLLPAWMPPIFRRGFFTLIDALLLDKLLAPNINRFRQRLDLPKVDRIFGGWMHSPQLNIGLFPDWFGKPQRDWPPQTRLTGFVFYHKQDGTGAHPPSFEELMAGGDPPIIFTAGTAMKHADRFFLDCIQACQLLGLRGILLTQYPEQLPAQLPQSIQHVGYLPFSTALPKALALVHHGGIGTTAQAIAAGIPQVIRPMAHDQPDTAARVERLGIGKSLSLKAFNGRSLAGKLEMLMASPAVLDRCRDYAQRVHPDQALDDTCRLIEDFASQAKPGPPGSGVKLSGLFARRQTSGLHLRGGAMNRRRAGFIFLGVCIVIAILLLTKAITPLAAGISFAIALVVLGWLSGGFRKQ